MKELPEDIQAKIVAYVEGELPADEAAALEVYLVNADPGLSEMVIGMMSDRQSLAVLPKISAPQDLTAQVLEQLERTSLLHGVENDLNRAKPKWWQSRAAIAAGVAIFLGGF
jgi:anti-sigma factor RsiW